MNDKPIHLSGLVALGGYTERGRRPNNEDAFSLPHLAANETERGTLIALADGVGGRDLGEAASQEAVNLLQELYYAASGTVEPGQRLRECVQAVNAINCRAQKRMGQQKQRLTTLVAAVIIHDLVYVVSVGDSLAYHIMTQKGESKPLVEAHTQKQALAKRGVETFDNHTITQAIGMEEELFVDLYHCQWRPGDGLVLTSDGLDKLPAEEVIQIVSRQAPQKAARQLVKKAIGSGSGDNCTAVVAQWQTAPRRSAMSSQRYRSYRWTVGLILLGALLGVLLTLLFLTFFPTRPAFLTELLPSDSPPLTSVGQAFLIALDIM